MAVKSTFIVLCALVCAVALRGQTHPETSPFVMTGTGLDIKVNVNSVLLNTSVRDRNSNRSISGLQLDDFKVYEDGILQQLQEARIADVPFNLLLLMDVSGSTYSFLHLMKKAATDFIYEMNPDDKIAVACFNSKTRLLQDFTSDFGAAAKAISHLHSDGGTAFYDALMTSVDQYMRNAEGRKAIVVFTDGVDNLLQGERKEGSHISFDQLYDRLQETDALIYTIFLNSKGREIMPGSQSADKKSGPHIPVLGRVPIPSSLPGLSGPRFPMPVPAPKPGPAAKKGAQEQKEENDVYTTAYAQLEKIAQLTGGRTYAPRVIDELADAYAEVADDLRVQYLLSYASSNMEQKEGWRSIQVMVKDHPEAVVRTRTGYNVKHPHQ